MAMFQGSRLRLAVLLKHLCTFGELSVELRIGESSGSNRRNRERDSPEHVHVFSKWSAFDEPFYTAVLCVYHWILS